MKLLIQYIRVILLFMPQIILADAQSDWDKIRFYALPEGRSYNISMGSGFFVNRNYIVTNRHVVTGCKNIAIRGAVPGRLVSLVKIDPDLDLALLYSDAEPARIPYLRINYDQIIKNDTLFTVGYPLIRGETGEYIIRQTNVIDVIKNPNNGFSSISFTDVVDHGNSGGPVLDKNSNISGVVVAQITYYQDDAKTIASKSVGIAIGLDGLIDFLRKNNIFFAANSTYDVFTNYDPDKIVRDYVVNIHCVQE
jgi:S1-C subfamily serine protease